MDVGTLRFVLELKTSGGLFVRALPFPEIVTHGKDDFQALSMAEDAIRLVIEQASCGDPALAHKGPRLTCYEVRA